MYARVLKARGCENRTLVFWVQSHHKILLSNCLSSPPSYPYGTFSSSPWSSSDCVIVMFDFVDELTIHRIPWLVWIQLLIMLLIIVFLYCCSIVAFDFSDDVSSAPASPSVLFTSAASYIDKPLRNSTAGTVISSHHNTKGGGGSQSRRGERATSTSRRRARGEDMLERVVSADRDLAQISLSDTCYHPCYYIRLARRVFLKCLGLESTSDDSSTPERRRDI